MCLWVPEQQPSWAGPCLSSSKIRMKRWIINRSRNAMIYWSTVTNETGANLLARCHIQLKNFPNLASTTPGSSSLFALPLNPRSCPAPSTGSKKVFAGINLRADSISSIVPNGSRVPCKNNVERWRLGRCWILSFSGCPGGCSGYDNSSSPSTSFSSASSMLAWRPP